MTATVNDDRTFTINKKACPVQRITFPDTAGNMTIACEFAETVNGGTGTLATTSLTVSYFGDSQVARCSDGINALATYTAEMTLTKQ